MKSPCMRVARLVVLLLCSAAVPVRAQDADLARAKAYFNAGAAAYEIGDYLAAIQALDAAYQLTPLPAIGFSLAQAERRQYFVSHDPEHLERAIALYRAYLQQMTAGGRRADATDALAQLEPLALAERSEQRAESAPPLAQSTRLMVTCSIPHAQISLDGAPATASPSIVQVAPGSHRVLVSAPGYVPIERTVEAVAGTLIPVEIALRERPAAVILRVEPRASLYVDGTPFGDLSASRQLQLPSGPHEFSFAKVGYEVQTLRVNLAPGGKRQLDAELHQTAQRTAALSLLVAGATSLAAGVVLSALAVDRENAAKRILRRKTEGNITAAELHDYADASQARDRLRIAGVVSLVGTAAALITGLALFMFDPPDLRETNTPATAPKLRFGATFAPDRHGGQVAVDTRLHF